MISPEAHCEFEWILLANSLRLPMDTRRYPSGISPFGSILSSEELSVYSAPIFLNEAEAAGGGICSLTTSSSPTNVISVAAFLASSMGTFFCFWTPLNFDSFFDNSFWVRTVFVRFFLLLASRYARDSRGVNTKSEITPCYAARPYKFGNIEQGWSWKGLQEQTNHRTSYQCKKPSKMHLFETVAMETENNFVYTTKD